MQARPEGLGTFVTPGTLVPAIILSFIASVGFCGQCGTPLNKSSNPGVNYVYGRCAPYINEAKEAHVIRSSGQAHYLRSCGEAHYQRTTGEAKYQRTCGEAHFVRTSGATHFVKGFGVAAFLMPVSDPSGPARQALTPSCR